MRTPALPSGDAPRRCASRRAAQVSEAPGFRWDGYATCKAANRARRRWRARGVVDRTLANVFVIQTLALTIAHAAHADTVYMRNGDRLTGGGLHMAAGKLTLDTAYAGKISVRWDEVASLATDVPVTLMLKNTGTIYTGRLAPTEDGYCLVDTEANVPSPGRVALSRLMYLNPTPLEAGGSVEYKRRINVSGSRTEGNSTGSNLNAEFDLQARATRYRYGVHANANQARLAGQTVTSNWLVSAHVDRFVLDPKHFRYVRASAQRDRFRDLRLRAAMGAGYGWQLIDSGDTQLALRGGLDLVAVRRYANPGDRYPALGWGIQFSHWLWRHRAEVFHTQDGYWGVGDSAEVTLRTRTGLRVPLAHGLLTTTQLEVDWDKRPSPAVKPTDSTLLIGIGYEW